MTVSWHAGHRSPGKKKLRVNVHVIWFAICPENSTKLSTYFIYSYYQSNMQGLKYAYKVVQAEYMY